MLVTDRPGRRMSDPTSARDLQGGMACIIPVLQIEDGRAICTIAAVVRRTPTTAMECASLLRGVRNHSEEANRAFPSASANADGNGHHHIDIRAHFIVELRFGVYGFLPCLIYRHG
jgi:hypothetical protein